MENKIVQDWELEKMEIQHNINKYKEAVVDITSNFIYKYFDTKWKSKEIIDAYVRCEVGGVIEINDYWFNFSDILYCMENNVSEKSLFYWYDYNLEWYEFEHYINLDAWMRGAPRRSPEELKKFKELQRKLNETKQLLEDEIEKANFKS